MNISKSSRLYRFASFFAGSARIETGPQLVAGTLVGTLISATICATVALMTFMFGHLAPAEFGLVIPGLGVLPDIVATLVLGALIEVILCALFLMTISAIAAASRRIEIQ